MSTVVNTAKPRRVPPPCWSQDEVHSLILAYRDRWFSLRRANLKAADWDHVALTTVCASSSSPAKTALQCRHKMEKLRKRYRSEKQRAARCPVGRFVSSWALFHLMDELESEPDPKPDNGGEFGSPFPLKRRNLVNVDSNFSPDVGFNGIGGSKFGVESQVCKNVGDQFMLRSRVVNSRFYSEGYEYVDQGGFPLKTRSNGKSGVYSFKQRGDYGMDSRSEGVFIPGGSLKRNVHSREFGGYSSLSGSKFVRQSGGVGVRRDVDPVKNLASSIMQLGEGFVRTEKMKMEMTMEIEKTRMEMELKRTEVMLESQQQIVDAFVDALLERKKKKKAKVEASHS